MTGRRVASSPNPRDPLCRGDPRHPSYHQGHPPGPAARHRGRGHPTFIKLSVVHAISTADGVSARRPWMAAPPSERCARTQSRNIGSSGTNCTWPSCSTSLSPSATSDSSGRGGCGSLTSDSSSLNCLFNLRHIISNVQFSNARALNAPALCPFYHLRTLRVGPGETFSGVVQTFQRYHIGCIKLTAGSPRTCRADAS